MFMRETAISEFMFALYPDALMTLAEVFWSFIFFSASSPLTGSEIEVNKICRI